MTLLEFEDSLETFGKDLLQGGDVSEYSSAVIQLINDFYTTSIQKTKEELVTDMLNYVTAVRGRK